MSTRRSKARAVARLDEERARLEATIAGISPSAMLQPGVVGAWSVKDVLAHLADWEEHMSVWLDAARRGERVNGPEPGLSWRQMNEFNRRIYEAHRRQRLEEVLDDFRTAHSRFMELVATMPEDEMLERGRYQLTGTKALFDWLSQYAEHDAWGSRRIGEWIAARASVANV